MTQITFTYQPLILTNPGEMPTIPSPNDLTPDSGSWDSSSNILVGQYAYNTIDDIWYYRGSISGIKTFITDKSEADIVLSTEDTYFSYYPIGSKVTFNINGNDTFLLTNITNVAPIVVSTDIPTAKTELLSEGWTIIVEPWSGLESYLIGDNVYYNNIIYKLEISNASPGAFEDQNWVIDTSIQQGNEIYKPLVNYQIGDRVKFYYNIFENDTAGPITPGVMSSDINEMIAEGWTIKQGIFIEKNSHQLLTPDGVWNTTIKDVARITDNYSRTNSFINLLPTLVCTRDPLSTDINVSIGEIGYTEQHDIELGWRWINTEDNSIWECGERFHNGSSWECKWNNYKLFDNFKTEELSYGSQDKILVGDISNHSYISIEFIATRGSIKEYGNISLTNISDSIISFVSKGGDTEILFSKEVLGNDINLLYTTPEAGCTLSLNIDREIL